MNKKISPTLIGAFVVGAVALLVIAVIAFGSGRLFRETKEFVLYFDGTVNGLHVGAPVKFKGVEIGSVKDILLQLDGDSEVNKIPVIIEIDLKKLTARGASGVLVEKQEAFQKAIVEQSLRAQLQTESMVTGVLYVGFDFFPGAPLTLVQKANTATQISGDSDDTDGPATDPGRSDTHRRQIRRDRLQGNHHLAHQDRRWDRPLGQLTGFAVGASRTRSNHAQGRSRDQRYQQTGDEPRWQY